MYVKFWGVRGSYPVPGPATNRIGGNTACVQVRTADGTNLVLDAGTGIRRLGQQLSSSGLGDAVHLLISHTHWDHIQGLPFFAPLYSADSRVDIYARQRDVHLKTLFSNQTREPYFPVGLEDVAARVCYHEVVEGVQFAIDGATVRCVRLNHPYIAIGYRIDADGGSLVYLTDTAPFDRMLLGYEFIERPDLSGVPTESDAEQLAAIQRDVVDICRGADVVIIDTMFEQEEYLRYPHWGHSTPEHALDLVLPAGAKCLALFHHHPGRTDEQQLAIEARVRQRSPIAVLAAYEGLQLHCGGSGAEVLD